MKLWKLNAQGINSESTFFLENGVVERMKKENNASHTPVKEKIVRKGLRQLLFDKRNLFIFPTKIKSSNLLQNLSKFTFLKNYGEDIVTDGKVHYFSDLEDEIHSKKN